MKARDVMTSGAEFVQAETTVREAAAKLAELDVGSLPICDGERLIGMITDRDIAVKVVAAGMDPATTRVGELAQGEAVTIGADDSVNEALRTMVQHAVRRLPVIDGRKLVGIVSQADIAKNVSEEQVGELVEAISSAP